MKYFTFILSWATLLSVSFFSGGCGKDNDNNNIPGQGKQEYKGNTHVIIDYWDYNVNTGLDEFIETKEYTYDSYVFIGPPKKTGNTIVETNQFNLQINPDRNINVDEEGHVDIISGQLFTVSTGEVLLQYWNYSLAGQQLTGTLTDNHVAEACAGNILWAWDDVAGIKMTLPFAIANGTTVNGTITGDQVSLTFTGQSQDTYRKFSCQINAIRQ